MVVFAIALAMQALFGALPSTLAAPGAVRLNQTGYLPNATKRATIVSTATAPLTWQLKNGSGTVVASGSTTVFGSDAVSGDSVHIADFSAVTTSGTNYVLQVGTETSYPFNISTAIYNKLKYDALAYFYHNRSGIAITLPYAGRSDLTRPAGHIGVAPNKGDTSVPCAPGTGCSYSLDVRGGWYDAGDHGKYVVNGGISLWTMLNQYERIRYLGTSLADFGDGKLSIPENANAVPDILDEARWQMEFMLRMQVPDTQPKAGMAHHKMHDEAWTGLPTRPDQDSQQRYLRPPSTAATLNLAATAAQCSRIWRTIDSAFATKCLTAAEKAWSAARANPSVIAPDSDGNGGGAYGDGQVSDEFYWAAAELYITTGKDLYKTFLTGSPHYRQVPSSFSNGEPAMTWGTTQAMGTISLAIVPNNLGATEINAMRNAITAAADVFVNVVNTQGYGTSLAPPASGYPWGSNSFVLNNALVMALAYDLTDRATYLSGVVQSMDYILGRNAMEKSYVSGYGENPLQNPHHRFWAYQLNASYPKPPAGAVSGGPNSGLQDDVARSRLSGCKPQKCFIDDINSWSTNEITINWNAPLAWVTAFLDEQGGGTSPVTPTPTPTTPPNVTPTPTPTTPPNPTPTPTPPPSSGTLKVQYRAANTAAADNEIKPFLQVVNTGSSGVPLSELKIRYWYTVDGDKPQNHWCDWAQIGCGNITARFVKLATPKASADYYLEVGFTGGTLAAGASTGEIQNRFAKNDWTNYNETGDYSFDATKTAYADWSRVTLYRNGTLIWGTEP
jgi:endoglucanase